MRTQLKNRKITFISDKLNKLIKECGHNEIIILYQSNNLLRTDNIMPIDFTIEITFNDGSVGNESYSTQENLENPFGQMAIKNGKLMDVIGISNKTYFTAE
jgi:hypothetical protein